MFFWRVFLFLVLWGYLGIFRVFFGGGIIRVFCSVADPDPVGSGLFGSPGSESGKIPDPYPDPLSTNRPHVIQIFSL